MPPRESRFVRLTIVASAAASPRVPAGKAARRVPQFSHDEICRGRDAVRLGRKEGLQPRERERAADRCWQQLARVHETRRLYAER